MKTFNRSSVDIILSICLLWINDLLLSLRELLKTPGQQGNTAMKNQWLQLCWRYWWRFCVWNINTNTNQHHCCGWISTMSAVIALAFFPSRSLLSLFVCPTKLSRNKHYFHVLCQFKLLLIDNWIKWHFRFRLIVNFPWVWFNAVVVVAVVGAAAFFLPIARRQLRMAVKRFMTI